MKRNYKRPSKILNFNKENSKYLLIVESPSKCAKIESYLGEQYKCIASKGHLRELDNYKNYDVKFKIVKDKSQHIQSMKEIIKLYKKENIILATDDDREGEAIAWHICEIFDLDIKSTKRIIFNEITKTALQNAVKEPKTINMLLVKSQKARQVLDVIVGYKISPFLWKHIYVSKTNSLSAGRCQTPALRLIYDNFLEKQSIKNEKYYKIIGNFFHKNIDFQLNKEMKTENETYDFLSKSKDFIYKLIVSSPRESKKSPPEPFNTSKLLQVCSNQLHCSPKETMSLCQILYQEGDITYMRTENKKYSNDFLSQGSQYIENNFGKKNIGYLNKIENDVNNPHEAIRVTNIENKIISNTNTRLVTLYKIIWKNTLESMMQPAIYDVYDCIINAPNDYKYKTTIEIPIFLGFLENSNMNLVEEQTIKKTLILYLDSIIKEKSKIQYNKISCTENIHHKHSHYSEASLIKKLEELGIGRPSTYAMFVDTILQRNYVKLQNIEGIKYTTMDLILQNREIYKTINEKTIGNENKKLVIQPLGILVIEFLTNYFNEIFSYGYTKNMEEDLDKIFNGLIDDWTQICKECENNIKIQEKTLKNLAKQTYQIDENHVFMFSKNGPTIKKTLENGEIEFKSIKNIQIDLDKLKNNLYELDDLIEENEKYLGTYENQELYIKKGKYGYYAAYGDNNKAMNVLKKPIQDITYDEVIEILNSENTSSNTVRIINDDISIRKGKYGLYAFYKTKQMSKPQFLNIKKFKESVTYCEKEILIEWLKTNYKIYS